MKIFKPHIKLVDGPSFLFTCEDISIEKPISIKGVTYFDSVLREGIGELYDRWIEKYPDAESQNREDIIEKNINRMIEKFSQF